MSEQEHAEVVVAGAGPAGLAAAAHAAEAGARVLLLDREPRPGGQVWRHRGLPPRAARPWIERVRRAGVPTLFEAVVVDAPAPGRLLVARENEGRVVRYERLVLATGARELFLPFPGWTLPGVVGVGAVHALLEQGARFEGLRVVVAGTGPLLPAVAAALTSGGARVVGVFEQASLARVGRFAAGLTLHPARALEGLGYRARLLAVPYRTGEWVASAAGNASVERATVTDGRRERTVECDVLACAFGLVPNLELPRLLGCATAAEAVELDRDQRTSVPGVFAAGELGGIAGERHATVSGAIAGIAAAGRAASAALRRARERERAFGRALARAFALRAELRSLGGPDTVVCRCEDVTLERLAPCRSAREAKLLTRAGMGPCQGRVCGPALELLRGWAPDSVRPPLEPVPVAVLASGWSDGGAAAGEAQDAGRRRNPADAPC